jgi:hypothetical protein
MTDWNNETIAAALVGDDADAKVRAAEMVAAAAGHAGDNLPDDCREWVETHGVPSQDFVEQALAAVRDLCARETDEASLTELRDLRFRLGDAAAP